MIRDLYRLAGPQGQRLLRVLIPLTVVEAVLQGALFVMLVPFLRALLTADSSQYVPWLIRIAVGTCGAIVLMVVSGVIARASSTAILRNLLDVLGSRVRSLPLGEFTHDRSGDLSDIATRGIAFAASVPQNIMRPVVAGLLTPAVILASMLGVDWRISLVMLVMVPFIVVAYRRVGSHAEATSHDYAEAVGAATSRIIEFARVQPALRAAGDSSIGDRLVAEAIDSQYQAFARSTRSSASAITRLGGTTHTMLALSVVTVAALTLAGELGAASAGAVLVLVVRFAEPIQTAGALSGGFAQGGETLRHLRHLAQAATMPEPEAPATPTHSGLELSRVTFGYGGRPVVKDISLEVEPGSMVAVVGPSGSGKTTLMRLLCRFYDPDQGTIRLGGVPLPQVGSHGVASRVAPVFQDVQLFSGSLLDNIWIGRPQASREEVLQAAAAAAVDEIATRAPGGWDTQVGEGGAALSGGERQRVSIARALLKDAPVLLLDEPTASLDIATERAITRALAQLRASRTIVVVAHRLHTIAGADKIIMLSADGRVAQTGTHAELLAAGGDYARYWAQRQEAAGWTLNAAGPPPQPHQVPVKDAGQRVPAESEQAPPHPGGGSRPAGWSSSSSPWRTS